MKLTKPHHRPHDFTGHLHYGIVKEIDPEKYKVRCIIPLLDDMETYWLPVMTLCAVENTLYHLPKKGAMVLLLLDSKGEEGIVLGSLYNDKDKPRQTDPDVHHFEFKNGTVIMHDEKTGDITVQTHGIVKVMARQVEIVAPNVNITGTVNVEGVVMAKAFIPV